MKKTIAGLAFLCLSAPTLAASLAADLILRHATIIDVEHSTLVADRAVVIRDSTLVDVGTDASLAIKWHAAISVDATGRYLIPGLWDMHVHFGGGPELIEENKALLPLYIAYGITTVRDCSGDLSQQVLKWRVELAQKTLLGPQLFTSGAKRYIGASHSHSEGRWRGALFPITTYGVIMNGCPQIERSGSHPHGVWEVPTLPSEIFNLVDILRMHHSLIVTSLFESSTRFPPVHPLLSAP